ncbi:MULTISPECIES: metalloregulator ArsR/SmtB family transcription factor [unclassified Nitrobacter]|uniref:ArsR/SmtB family transcription factor n=1 Tax=unclassified Nitrobacter TaxID=2620411 RepID=UPI00092A813C|nr:MULTISPECIES: metalloregulator ArsR/SmtB family transcription factor [unclassified Nitrobacter]MBN9147108.1 helix-turn-helix transcriptional regulator [Nitrobacter sp.]OJV02389.1 MAG: transcriptional regulator [Nitrobacter sp. 62-23]
MRALWQSREQADSAADKLRKFAQPQRLMILSLLREGEKSVTEIDVATRIGQPALSQQLAELRKAELVTTRRQAKQIYYSLAHESVALCVRSIEAVFNAGDPKQVLLDMARPDLRLESEGVVRGAANFARLR